MEQVILIGQKGEFKAPGKRLDYCTHFAVTMARFGYFDVTHAPSGKGIIRNFERAINAFEAMILLQEAADKLGIPTDADEKSFLQAINKPVKVKALGDLKFIEYCQIKDNVITGDEFPWESDETCPHYRVAELCEKHDIEFNV